MDDILKAIRESLAWALGLVPRAYRDRVGLIVVVTIISMLVFALGWKVLNTVPAALNLSLGVVILALAAAIWVRMKPESPPPMSPERKEIEARVRAGELVAGEAKWLIEQEEMRGLEESSPQIVALRKNQYLAEAEGLLLRTLLLCNIVGLAEEHTADLRRALHAVVDARAAQMG